MSDELERITETGRKALRDDTQMDDENRLILEIMNRTGAVDELTVCRLYEELVSDYFGGSVSAALEALKAGHVALYREEEDT
jgi:hypothetical protein